MWDKLLYWLDLNNWTGIAPAASEHAASIDMLLNLVHWFMLVLFVGWTYFFLSILWRFNRAKNPKADYIGFTGHQSTFVEVGVIVVEAFLLVGLAFPLWAKRVNEFPPEDKSLQIKVIGEQFAWNIHYTGPDGKFGKQQLKLVNPDNPLGIDRTDPDAQDDIVTMNQLHLPVNRDVTILVTSKDVIHSFALREMRTCQDAIPGMQVPIWFKPTVTTEEMRKKLGDDKFEYEIMCAQLCGLGHYRMRGFVTVETQEQFDTWIAEQAKQAKEGAAGAAQGSGGGEYE
jgi:cytochrome c oxidase subunit II